VAIYVDVPAAMQAGVVFLRSDNGVIL